MGKLKSILTFLAVFGLCILGIEMYLQVTEIDLSYHTLDPHNGKQIQKNHRIIMLKEGFYLGGSNEYGYLGPAYAPGMHDGKFRIAMMGDSYAEGLQVFDQFHLRTVLERELSQKTGREVEVLNFGSGDFDLHDMYRYYLNSASTFQPDLLCFFMEPKRLKTRDNYFLPAPRFYLDHDSLKINYDFVKEPKFKLYQHIRLVSENSSFFKMALNAYKIVSRGRAPKVIFGKIYEQLYFEEGGVDPKLKNINVVHPEDISPVTHRIMDLLGDKEEEVFFVSCDTRFSADIMSIIREKGIHPLNTEDTLEVLVHQGIDPQYWEATGRRGHWNHQAHEIIGQYLANQLAPLLLKKDRGDSIAALKEELTPHLVADTPVN